MLPDATPLSFPDFHHFSRYLDSLGLFHMDLSLDRVRASLHGLGRAPRFMAVQVVGTNGKGSTAAFLESMARAHGLRTGLFTSPHFVDVRERILMDGAMLPEAEWVRLANRVMQEQGRAGLTYFELLFAMAVLAFDEQKVDLAVFEAGLGGQWDATTVLAPVVTRPLVLFTPFGLDHEHVLGQGLTAIATDKARALEAGMLGLSAPQQDEAWAPLQDRAHETGAELRLVERGASGLQGSGSGAAGSGEAGFEASGSGVAGSGLSGFDGAESGGGPSETGLDWIRTLLSQANFGLRGPHQQDNARLALAGWLEAARMLHGQNGVEVDRDACLRGLNAAFLPGRFQVAEPEDGPLGGCTVILDGAHNAPALESLARALEVEGVTPDVLVTAVMKDKNLESMLSGYQAVAGPNLARVFCPGIPNLERLRPPGDLARRLSDTLKVQASEVSKLSDLGPALVSGGRSDTFPTNPDTRRPVVLLCGSLYLLAEFYRLYPRFLRP